MEVAEETILSPWSSSIWEYQERKKSPYSEFQPPDSFLKKLVSSGQLLYSPASVGPVLPHSGLP